MDNAAYQNMMMEIARIERHLEKIVENTSRTPAADPGALSDPAEGEGGDPAILANTAVLIAANAQDKVLALRARVEALEAGERIPNEDAMKLWIEIGALNAGQDAMDERLKALAARLDQERMAREEVDEELGRVSERVEVIEAGRMPDPRFDVHVDLKPTGERGEYVAEFTPVEPPGPPGDWSREWLVEALRAGFVEGIYAHGTIRAIANKLDPTGALWARVQAGK